MMLLYGAGAQLLRGGFRPVWQRAEQPGFVGGSLGGFVVLEARAHAEARGARGLARLAGVAAGMSRRATPLAAAAEAERLYATIRPAGRDGALGVLSGAMGTEPATAAERRLLATLAQDGPLAVRATGTMLGHGVEAQFPANVALAALALSRGGFFPPFDESGMEAEAGVPARILVTGFGQRRGEALALLERVEGIR